MGYFLRLAARVRLYALSHRQDNTHHSLCYTSRGSLAGARNSAEGVTNLGNSKQVDQTGDQGMRLPGFDKGQ